MSHWLWFAFGFASAWLAFGVFFVWFCWLLPFDGARQR